jgi:hypothetical protein
VALVIRQTNKQAAGKTKNENVIVVWLTGTKNQDLQDEENDCMKIENTQDFSGFIIPLNQKTWLL